MTDNTSVFNSIANTNRFLHGFSFPGDGQRKIVPSKYSGTLNQELVDEIIQKTIYLTWSDIKDGARKLVSEFQPEGKFLIHLEKQIGSETILLAETWDLWQNKLPSGFIDKDTKFQPNETVQIIILDDWSLTGNRKVGLIDELTYYNPNTIFRFHVLIPYISQDARIALQSICPDITISSINGNWQVKTIEIPMEFTHHSNAECGSEHLFCIYSDLKIPDTFCCPRVFYQHTVTPPPFNLKTELIRFFPDWSATAM